MCFIFCRCDEFEKCNFASVRRYFAFGSAGKCSDVATYIFCANSSPIPRAPAQLPNEKFVQLVYNNKAHTHELINK